MRESGLAWWVLERVRRGALLIALDARWPGFVRWQARRVALRIRRWEWSPSPSEE